jgi:hypothetical protein
MTKLPTSNLFFVHSFMNSRAAFLEEQSTSKRRTEEKREEIKDK